MSKNILNTTIRSITGHPHKIPFRNDDGEVIFEGDKVKTLKMEDATTASLLRMIILTVPKELTAQNDGLYKSQLWNDILKADGTGVIELHDKTYNWIKRTLNRQMPLTAEEKASGEMSHSLAVEYFGGSEYTILEQLKDEGDKAPINLDQVADG